MTPRLPLRRTVGGWGPRERLEALTVAVGGILIRSGSPSSSPSTSHAHPGPHLVHTASGTPFSLTNPDWIAASATVILAIGAIVTSYFAVRAFGKQSGELGLLQKQAQRQEEEQRRSQARDVSAWSSDTTWEDVDDKTFLRVIVSCRNISALPVFGVKLTAEVGTHGSMSMSGFVLPPSNEPIKFDMGSMGADYILDRMTRRPRITDPRRQLEASRSPVHDDVKAVFPVSVSVEIEFTDVNEIRWRRDVNGVLRELGESHRDQQVNNHARRF